MRQLLSERKVRRLAEQTGLDVVAVMVRGGTGHRKDLCLADGSIVCLWPDGTMHVEEGWTWDPDRGSEEQKRERAAFWAEQRRQAAKRRRHPPVTGILISPERQLESADGCRHMWKDQHCSFGPEPDSGLEVLMTRRRCSRCEVTAEGSERWFQRNAGEPWWREVERPSTLPPRRDP